MSIFRGLLCLLSAGLWLLGAQLPGWQYEKTGGGGQRATLTSVNRLAFAYPYNQPTSVTLGLRRRDATTYAYLETPTGFFTRSFQNGTARVRFDGRAPTPFALTAAANGRANIVFFADESRLIRQLRASRRITVELQFAGQPTRQLRFETAGLRWP